MLKHLFVNRKKSDVLELAAPIEGEIISLEDVPDPVFSQKMMGDGIAFFPIDGRVVAPADSTVLSVFPTKHAICLETDHGLEILIHIGLDTVNMKGEGFEVQVEKGQHVRKGDLLVLFDLQLVREKASSTITPMIISNQTQMGEISYFDETVSEAGKTIVMTVQK